MSKSARATFVGTAEVAASLGVGVSTVKRWVDEGVLPAVKTAGGHRKLLLADVLRFARDGGFPELGVRRPGAAAPSDNPAAARNLFDCLRVGDAEAARLVIHRLHRAGVPASALADEVVAPAMHRIGREWQAGRIGVMHEHRAVQICLSALLEARPSLAGGRGRGPVAVGGSPEGDPYLMAGVLAQMTLLEDGWHAINLGPHTPPDAFRRALAELRPRLLWISATWLPDPQSFLAGMPALLDDAKKLGTAVVIGGQAADASLRGTIPYASFGGGLADLASFARALNPRKSRPKRGRPFRRP